MKIRVLFGLLILISFCISSTIVKAQIIMSNDIVLEEYFASQVKSIDEFMARFNGAESKPGLPIDSLNRRNNIISLFDFSQFEKEDSSGIQKQSVLEFCKNGIEWGRKLSLLDNNSFAETTCTFKYNKKEVKLTLFLQLESINDDRHRWGIAGVTGLKEAGFYNDKRATISPVEHEIHFLGLTDFFISNKNLTHALRSRNKKIDEFSLLTGLLYSSSIQFVSIDEVKFHFCDVPEYVFVVEEVIRKGNNSGWLITKLLKTDDNEKKVYLKNLYGEK